MRTRSRSGNVRPVGVRATAGKTHRAPPFPARRTCRGRWTNRGRAPCPRGPRRRRPVRRRSGRGHAPPPSSGRNGTPGTPPRCSRPRARGVAGVRRHDAAARRQVLRRAMSDGAGEKRRDLRIQHGGRRVERHAAPATRTAMSRASAAFVRQEAYTIAPASSRFVVTTAAPSVRSSRISRKPQYCCSSRSPVFRREREG